MLKQYDLVVDDFIDNSYMVSFQQSQAFSQVLKFQNIGMLTTQNHNICFNAIGLTQQARFFQLSENQKAKMQFIEIKAENKRELTLINVSSLIPMDQNPLNRGISPFCFIQIIIPQVTTVRPETILYVSGFIPYVMSACRSLGLLRRR